MWKIDSISPTIRPFEDRIWRRIEAVRERIADVSDVVPMRFILKADRTRTLPMHGFGGYCGDPDLIRLSFDPKNPAMRQHLDETLERVVCHEYHHALRALRPGYGAKLGSALVAEGLAGHFVRQIYRTPPEPWEMAVIAADLDPWRRQAFDLFDGTKHGHATWFFGRGDMPNWLGYSLGYDLIGRYLSANAGETAMTLAHEPHMTFRRSVLTPPG